MVLHYSLSHTSRHKIQADEISIIKTNEILNKIALK